MKATLFALFIALLLVGCGEDKIIVEEEIHGPWAFTDYYEETISGEQKITVSSGITYFYDEIQSDAVSKKSLKYNWRQEHRCKITSLKEEVDFILELRGDWSLKEDVIIFELKNLSLKPGNSSSFLDTYESGRSPVSPRIRSALLPQISAIQSSYNMSETMKDLEESLKLAEGQTTVTEIIKFEDEELTLRESGYFTRYNKIEKPNSSFRTRWLDFWLFDFFLAIYPLVLTALLINMPMNQNWKNDLFSRLWVISTSILGIIIWFTDWIFETSFWSAFIKNFRELF